MRNAMLRDRRMQENASDLRRCLFEDDRSGRAVAIRLPTVVRNSVLLGAMTADAIDS